MDQNESAPDGDSKANGFNTKVVSEADQGQYYIAETMRVAAESAQNGEMDGIVIISLRKDGGLGVGSYCPHEKRLALIGFLSVLAGQEGETFKKLCAPSVPTNLMKKT